jgi:hypothetical protein
MADIELSNLTDSTNADNGTGVFDKLIQSVEHHIESQYKAGRITGNDYSNVYLGSMQSVLSESVKFLLSEQQVEKEVDLLNEQIISEQKKNEAGGLIDLEKKKNQEQIDLIIAQTASQYEGIDASRKDTNRKNLLNSKQVIKIGKESELLTTQNSELLLNGVVERALKDAQRIATASGAIDNTNKVNAEVAFTNAKEDDQVYITTNIRPLELSKLDEEIDLLQSRDVEQIAATVRMDLESAKKVLLIEAQTLGFKVDGKQKLLKQMFEGFAIETTTNGAVTAPAPSLNSSASLEMVANSIFDDLAPTEGTI